MNRCHVQEKMSLRDIFLSRALAIPLFSGLEPFVQFCAEQLSFFKQY